MTASRLSLAGALRGERKEQALEALIAELRAQYEVQKTLKPVKEADLTKEEMSKRLRSLTFVKEKFKPDGSFDKTKARMTIMGNFQKPGTYSETWAGTANPLSIMTLLDIATQLDYDVESHDIPNAFLIPEMEEGDVIHVELEKICSVMLMKLYPELEQYRTARGTIIMKLEKYVYGLKQAARKFSEHVQKILVKHGFKPTRGDPCVFVLECDGGRVYIAIHVDDLLVVGTNVAAMDKARSILKAEFSSTESSADGRLFFLGMHIVRDRSKRVMRVTMDKHVSAIVEKHAERCKAQKTPAAPDLFDESTGEAMDATAYASVLMSLMYVARFTRPDILLAVNALATKMAKPTASDWKKLFRVLGYVKATPDKGLTFKAVDGGPKLKLYVDASHAVHPDGKGQGGMVITLGSAPILAKTWKFKHVTLSSTEAELSALAEAATYVVWTREFLADLGFPQGEPTTIYEDNMSAIQMSKKGGGNFKRSKHLMVRQTFINELIDSGVLSLQYCPTNNMVADFLTKPVDRATLMHLLELGCIE